MAGKQIFSLAALQYNLQRLLLIRGIVFVCQLLALFYAYFWLALTLDYFYIGLTLFLFVCINLALVLRLRQNWVVSELEFLTHLLIDVLGLSVLLYFSGGANNPFVSYFLVPVTISAAILPWSYTWIVATASLLSYSCLLFFYQPLPELMPMDPAMGAEAGIPNLHIVGMWFNFLVSAGLITYFVVKMAEEIRTQQDKLTFYKEENLRDEQILAVATQAAGTAHELGTPLNTIAILLNDMAQDHASNAPLQENLALIKQQLSLCKTSLQALAQQADFRSARASRELKLTDFIAQVLDQWQLLRPEIALTVSMQQQTRVPDVTVESTLQQAIVNILNNAADASPQGLEICLAWDEQQWFMKIRDFGEGINAEIKELLGNRVVSTKEDGLGVGLILSHASISRLGGQLSLYRHEEQGTISEIRLPLREQSSRSVHAD